MLRGLFGQRLKRLREERGWSQEKLAELSGLSDREIRRIENAHSAANLDTVEKLATALEIHPVKLFAFDWPLRVVPPHSGDGYRNDRP